MKIRNTKSEIRNRFGFRIWFFEFRSAATLCFLLAAATATAGQQDAVRAVVRVPSHGGSATIIATEQGNTYLLTAAHLFAHGASDPIVIDGEDAPQGAARRIGIDQEADLALIQLSAARPSMSLRSR